MFVRPNPLRIEANPQYVVADPALRDFIPVEGRLVQDTGYWHQLLAVGDIVLGEDKSKKTKSANENSTVEKG